MRPTLLAHRLGLLWTLVRTDFKVRYHGTFGGFLWALLKPLTMFLVLMAVFSLVFASTPDYRLNLVLGLFLWDFFAEGTRVGLVSLHHKGYLLGKARFPVSLVVVAALANALLTLVVFSAAFTLALAWLGRFPGPAALLSYAGQLVALFALVAGFSLATSVLFLRWRDLNQVWEVASQAGFFLAPIIWPLSLVPERLHLWLYLWPPTPVVELARAALVAGVVPSARAHLLLGSLAAVALLGGTLVFRRLAPAAAERV